MSELKYEYLYSDENVLTNVSNAIKGNKYRLYPNTSLDYIFRSGDVNTPHFSLKSYNPFANTGLTNANGNPGESIEHYNAKMKIVHDKKYFDTIFNQWVEFDEVIPEEWHSEQSKRPDLSCYNNGKLVACIEIHYTNEKSNNDIEKLKELDCLIIEIDIKNENRCKHIALPKIFELYRSKYNKIDSEIRNIEKEEFELKREIEELANNLQTGLSDIERESTSIETEIKRKTTTRIEKINSYLQKRLSKIITDKIDDDRISQIERDIERTKNNNEKIDYRLGKIEREIELAETDIRSRRNAFKQIASKSKIEWFRNSWIKYNSQNLVQEIRYWLS